MQDAYQVMITLQLRAPNGHSNFYSTVRGTLRDTHRIHVYYVNGRVKRTGHEIVGELFHDHEMVRNVTYESLWDNLGMSDIKQGNFHGPKILVIMRFHCNCESTITL